MSFGLEVVAVRDFEGTLLPPQSSDESLMERNSLDVVLRQLSAI
jgi:hypothetical protein